MWPPTRPKIPQLAEALTGNFADHHAFLCRLHLQRIDQLSAAILELSRRIENEMRPFARQPEQLATIPGVGQATAEVIIAETGADMTVPERLAAYLLELTQRHGTAVAGGTEIDVLLSPRELAGAIGASREAVAHCLPILRERRVVVTRWRVVVLQPEALRSRGTNVHIGKDGR